MGAVDTAVVADGSCPCHREFLTFHGTGYVKSA